MIWYDWADDPVCGRKKRKEGQVEDDGQWEERSERSEPGTPSSLRRDPLQLARRLMLMWIVISKCQRTETQRNNASIMGVTLSDIRRLRKMNLSSNEHITFKICYLSSHELLCLCTKRKRLKCRHRWVDLCLQIDVLW